MFGLHPFSESLLSSKLNKTTSLCINQFELRVLTATPEQKTNEVALQKCPLMVRSKDSSRLRRDVNVDG